MTMRSNRIGLLTALLLASTGMPAYAGEQAVIIDNFAFQPAQLTVDAGTTVVWTNRDDIPHTVASGDSTLRSPPLDTGDVFRFAFTQKGTYRYFCTLHPHMQGTVIVR
ncbi:MAG: cupredoxin family copper-binding protein [Alphaproteobacteria bacterium]|nr:cupredoxin family copper-binding protein [Alphaproteobacteria bacterium]